MPDYSRSFSICGHTLRLVCEDARQAEQVEALWRQCFVPRPSKIKNQKSERIIPTVLLFPKITHQPQSQLVAMDETSAMIALMEHSAGIMTDAAFFPCPKQVLI